MSAPAPQSQPRAEPVRQSAPLWELHKQDDYADHEFSFWFDGEIVVLANPAFGRVAALQEMVDGLNSHVSLKARAEQAEQAVDVLESNAREQAKLLADTGRRVEELAAALTDCVGCVAAAEAEGLHEVIDELRGFSEQTDHLIDLIERRLLWVRNYGDAALSPSTPAVSR